MKPRPEMCLLLAFLTLLALACQPEPPGEEILDEVEVNLGPTKTLTVEQDQKGSLPGVETGLTGLLPSDFPSDIPLPSPASVADLADTRKVRFVELSVPRSLDDVRVAVHAKLSGAGWSQTEGSSYAHVADRSRTIDVQIRGDRNATSVRIDYTSAVRARK